jgi:rifampicin phosphotransferase
MSVPQQLIQSPNVSFSGRLAIITPGVDPEENAIYTNIISINTKYFWMNGCFDTEGWFDMEQECSMISFFGQLKKELEPFAGGKGRTLARLYQAGYRIPDGFIILPQAFAKDKLVPDAWVQIQAGLTRLRRNNNDVSFAVRSSAWSEDSAQASFAGEFETVLDVRTDDDIREAIIAVRLSRHNARVRAYSQAQGLENEEQEMAVIIQRLIRADISGVLFTVDPVAGSSMHMTGNFIYGIGEKLVSGHANPQTFTFDRPKGLYDGPQELRQTARALYHNAMSLERAFGTPQDIEWAIANRRLYILQSRPITTLSGYKADTCEWNDSYTGEFLWCNTNLSEQAPEVRTPFSCSLFKIHESEGPYSNVYRGMSVDGHPLTGIIGGRAYSNLSVLLTANRPMAGGDVRKAAKMLSATYGEIPEGIDIPLLPLSAWSWWTQTLPGMLRYVAAMNRHKKQIPQYIAENPNWCAGMRQKFQKAEAAEELAALWQNEIKPHYLYGMLLLFASTIDISPRLERKLQEWVSPDDANTLLSNLSGKSGELESLGPVIGIGKVASGTMSREQYWEAYGHRGANEFEYAWPRPMEDPEWLNRQLAEYARSNVDIEALFSKKQAAFEGAWQRFVLRDPKKAEEMKGRLAHAAQVAKRREAIRSEAMRVTSVIRAFALRAGELTGIGEDIFFLPINEVCDLLTGNSAAVRLIALRKETYARYKALPQYPSIIAGRFDPFQWAADPHRRSDIYVANAPSAMDDTHAANTIKGFAGALGVVEGTVRCIEHLEDSDQFQSGEILVTSTTNIGWTPIFPRAAAIITDIGAPLSHAAIVARELGIPAVVGCGNATMVLKTGDWVRVDGGKGLVEIIRRSV